MNILVHILPGKETHSKAILKNLRRFEKNWFRKKKCNTLSNVHLTYKLLIFSPLNTSGQRGGELDRSGSTQRCREQKKSQNEQAELFFICEVSIYRKKRSRMVEHTTSTVGYGEGDYRLLFSFFFFPVEMPERSFQSAVLRN